MRDLHQEILFAVGGSLVFDAPEGRPSSVTSVTVYEATSDDTSTAVSATTGSASVETNPNTTFDAASGAGQTDPTKCFLTATTGIVRGRSYLATNSTGDKEWVPVTAITSADSVFSRVPLLNAYAAADTFQSTRMSISIDSSWAAAVSNLSSEESPFPRYRVVWVYVVNSVTYRHQTFFDLVRYSAWHGVTGADVDARFPGWLDSLPVDMRREQGQSFIDQAFRSVKMDMLADAKAGRWLRHQDVLNELVVYRANVLSRETGVLLGRAAFETLDLANKLYTARYDQLVREAHVPLDATSGGAGFNDKTNDAPLFSR